MKKILAILLAFVLVFSMAACGGGGNNYDEGPIKIGWIGALTGDFAPWGKCESQALQMYINEQNEAGGVLGRQL